MDEADLYRIRTFEEFHELVEQYNRPDLSSPEDVERWLAS